MAVWGNYSQGIMEYDTTSASNITTLTTQSSQSPRINKKYINIGSKETDIGNKLTDTVRCEDVKVSIFLYIFI